MTTEDQAHILTHVMLLTEMWLSKWQELIDSGYEPRQEFKFHAKNFKASCEKLQKQLFDSAAHKLINTDYKQFEKDYVNKVAELEILFSEYLNGKVEVKND